MTQPTGKIEKLVFGAEGILREPSGRIVFVPYTLPGEWIEYQITEEKKDFARAKAINILQDHPQRIAPLCPHYGRCTGCQLQHASLDLQLLLKKQWLEEQLKRIAKIDLELTPLKPFQEWAYRRSVEWTYENHKLGYHDDKAQLVEIERCLLIQDDQKSLNLAKLAVQLLKIKQARIRYIHQPAQLPIFAIETPSRIQKDHFAAVWSELQESLAGLIVHTNKKIQHHGGQIKLQALVNGLSIEWDALGFLQNHFEASLAFYNWISEHLSGKGLLLDLYCGVGITSLLAARKEWQVHGFELNKASVAMAKKNAITNNLSHLCQFFAQNLDTALPQKLDLYQALVINPPRQGVNAQLLRAISTSPISQVLYLSCNPSTLARDIKALIETGFSISALQAFDCFSQTYHFETAVLLKR